MDSLSPGWQLGSRRDDAKNARDRNGAMARNGSSPSKVGISEIVIHSAGTGNPLASILASSTHFPAIRRVYLRRAGTTRHSCGIKVGGGANIKSMLLIG
jgi:hypothetical protein